MKIFLEYIIQRNKICLNKKRGDFSRCESDLQMFKNNKSKIIIFGKPNQLQLRKPI